jgi:hypothetical protein
VNDIGSRARIEVHADGARDFVRSTSYIKDLMYAIESQTILRCRSILNSVLRQNCPPISAGQPKEGSLLSFFQSPQHNVCVLREILTTRMHSDNNLLIRVRPASGYFEINLWRRILQHAGVHERMGKPTVKD